MILGALQSSYLPWLGYFEQIYQTDLFLICDELNYEKYSWRNRNRVKTNSGATWLSVPVEKKGVNHKAIKDVLIDNSKNWRNKHLSTLKRFYSGTTYFSRHEPYFNDVFSRQWEFLSELNIELTRYLTDSLGIKTELVVQSKLGLENKFQTTIVGDATDRLVFFCRELGASRFYEGQAGKNYVDEERVRDAGIELIYQEYSHPVYPQLYGDFIPYLSVVDLLFNCGDNSLDILTGAEAPSR